MPGVVKKVYELLVGEDAAMFPGIPSVPSVRFHKKGATARKLSKRELIQRESEVGGQLFGPVPKGHRREFFNLDPKTWIWHEEWTDHAGKRRMATTRYEIHENGILKAQEGARYNFIEGQEFDNFILSTRLYYERISREIYSRDPQTGQPLAPLAA